MSKRTSTYEKHKAVKYGLRKVSQYISQYSILMIKLHCESKKTGPLFTAYNFRNIEQIFTKLGTNHVLFILNIMP